MGGLHPLHPRARGVSLDLVNSPLLSHPLFIILPSPEVYAGCSTPPQQPPIHHSYNFTLIGGPLPPFTQPYGKIWPKRTAKTAGGEKYRLRCWWRYLPITFYDTWASLFMQKLIASCAIYFRLKLSFVSLNAQSQNKSTKAINLPLNASFYHWALWICMVFCFWDKLPHIRYYTIIILYYSLALLFLSLLSNHESKAWTR